MVRAEARRAQPNQRNRKDGEEEPQFTCGDGGDAGPSKA